MVKLTALPAAQGVVNHYNGSAYDWNLSTINGEVQFYCTDGTNLLSATTSGAGLVVGGTYHLAAVWAGSNTLAIYVNGVPMSWSSYTSQQTPTSVPLSRLYIGSAATLASFNGLIQEVAYYNKALSAAGVLADYAAGIATSTLAPRLACGSILLTMV